MDYRCQGDLAIRLEGGPLRSRRGALARLKLRVRLVAWPTFQRIPLLERIPIEILTRFEDLSKKGPQRVEQGRAPALPGAISGLAALFDGIAGHTQQNRLMRIFALEE